MGGIVLRRKRPAAPTREQLPAELQSVDDATWTSDVATVRWLERQGLVRRLRPTPYNTASATAASRHQFATALYSERAARVRRDEP